jgi:hypothetical protein
MRLHVTIDLPDSLHEARHLLDRHCINLRRDAASGRLRLDLAEIAITPTHIERHGNAARLKGPQRHRQYFGPTPRAPI